MNKGFLSTEEASEFTKRQADLLSRDAAAKSNSSVSLPASKPVLTDKIDRDRADEIEREITVLNADIFKAMNKSKSKHE